MAKLLYEEERIKNIADKIKQFVPYLRIDRFTTKEMADGVEHVHEAGKARGRAEGYDDGRSEGYNIGYTNGCEKGYSDGHDKGYQSGLADGTKAVKEGESRSESDIIIDGDSFTVPSGYYALTAEKHINIDPFYDAGYIDGYVRGKAESSTYEDGYRDGLTDGEQKVKTEEARTEADLELEQLDNETLGLRAPSGYYANDAHKQIDIKPYYNEGYALGYGAGYRLGFDEGTASVGTYEDGNGVRY